VTTAEELASEVRRRLAGEAGADAQAWAGDGVQLRRRVAELVEEHAAPLEQEERDGLVERVLARTLGLGPLEPLMADPSVDEVMVNGAGSVLVERAGRIEPTPVTFESDEELMHVIERILSPLGRRVDEASPLVDARLPDGSRVNCVIPPLSLDGPLLTVRRFRRCGFEVEELIGSGTLTRDVARFLAGCVAARCNLVVSGGTASGKTTLLNVLSSLIGSGERIITIEDAAELRLRQPHVLRLEARPPNVEGGGEITIRALVRNALRMRPDRIVVGEVRGPEALDMLQALNTGHDGSMTTVHANSAADALRRIETLALMAGIGLPHRAVREQLASALDVVVHVRRLRDGSRRVAGVGEVVRAAGDAGIRELFALRGGLLRIAAAPTDGLGSRLAEASPEALA
jgi:pilus assembly protein CpaF